MADQWHYFVDRKQCGPVPLKRLKELAGMGVVGPTSEVWQEGTPDWVVASSVPDLFPNDRISAKVKEASLPTSPMPDRTAPASIEQPRPPQTRSAKWGVLVGICLLLIVLVGGGIAFTVLGRKSSEQKKVEPVAESTKAKPPEIPPQEKEAIENTIKALMKLDSITSTGLNYTEYSSKLLDIKVEFDSAFAKIPNSNPIRVPLAKAMLAFVEARDFWGWCLNNKGNFAGYIWKNGQIQKEVMDCHKDLFVRKLIPDFRQELFESKDVPIIWNYATVQVKKAKLIQTYPFRGNGEVSSPLQAAEVHAHVERLKDQRVVCKGFVSKRDDARTGTTLTIEAEKIGESPLVCLFDKTLPPCGVNDAVVVEGKSTGLFLGTVILFECKLLEVKKPGN